ncbi:PREDICTED: phospholipase B1, membrane-associated-like [Nicrophorus vespilloides]|uniref:Phospholipase B1, membrane-associated-like n=1 Tax=Nicrophorus vespilloides TaxID=110193 RepID=A0ABM1MFM5_NICVS|nr:PREDICTED: phospholipase B1, membrane-associated-like [Nicrophorus vespilloides]XP_017773377.1 PREDICTED: phospholipase B1, membrane-associated-like [Nicrophorus vespilloides]XP_017773378.1 PREDICTED: phospholipase B1, membrane-associated-like [Nicrophorus vespilloides]
MWKFTVAAVFLLIVGCSDGQRTFLDAFLVPFRKFKVASTRLLDSSINFDELRRRNKLQPEISEDVPFPCDLRGARSAVRPKSVHQLRPGDIDVVGAIGDSLTAGFGLLATTLPQVFLENRGLSFSIGGVGTWRQYITVPNLLKVFNPNLVGFSTTYSSITTQRSSQFNVAEGGAVSQDTPYMAKVLVTRILYDPRIDRNNDWKLITIMIGPNDFCSRICRSSNMEQELSKHEDHIVQVLRTIRDNLPRTIVNLIPSMDTFALKRIRNKPAECYLTHSAECSCVFGVLHQKNRAKYRHFIQRWQNKDVEIASRKEFQRDDFSVVPQILTINMSIPLKTDNDFDLSYLSADCFHFSQKGGAILALGIWNGMLQPVGRKTPIMNYHNFTDIRCPDESNPYIFTLGNS